MHRVFVLNSLGRQGISCNFKDVVRIKAEREGLFEKRRGAMKMHHLFICIAVIAVGCGGAAGKAGSTGGPGAGQTMGRVDDGAKCETENRSESLVDLNQDGTPDVRKVYLASETTKVLVCREADLNFDGTKDIFVFFDQKGQISRDEVDLDYDGSIDIISTYAKGKVVKQEIDTNSDGLVDRIRHLEADVPVRVEGDTDGDRRIDYWEYYEAGRLIRIGVDEDGDGRADNWSRDDETEAAALEEAGTSEAEEGEPAEEEAPAAPAEDQES